MQKIGYGFSRRKFSFSVERDYRTASLLFGAACAALAAPVMLHANTTYYFGGANGLWNTASNWSPATVPTGSSADAYIGESGATTTVVLDAAYTSSTALDSLTINCVSVSQITLLQNAAASAMVATNESIGTTVSPNFYNQSAGTNTVTNLLAFGTQAGGLGDYFLSGSGVLNAATEEIGTNAAGSGAFYQSGGTNITSYLLLGEATEPTLTNGYTLTGGTLNASTGSIYVAGAGTSTFTQTGGTVDIGEFFYIEGYGSSYTLSGNGTINSTPNQDGITMLVGSQIGTNDSFVQTGGTISLGSIEGKLIVVSAGALATYTLSATTGTGSLSADFEGIGMFYGAELTRSSSGTFNQLGGSNSITAALNIGGNYSTPPSASTVATGLYNITGGTLNTGTINACQISSGAINQSGGTVTCLQLAVGDTQYSSGVYTLAGGNLNVANGAGSLLPGYSLIVGETVPTPNFGFFNQTGGSANVQGLALGDCGLGFFDLSGTGTFNCSGPAEIGLANSSALINLVFYPSKTMGPANGFYFQPGGTAIFTGGMIVGDYQSGNTASGQVTLTGGTMNLISSSLILGLGGSGAMNQTGGTLTAGSVQIANGSTGIGTYSFNGGMLVTSNIFKGTGTASFDFNGGTLVAASSTSSLFSNFSPTLNTSGATLNTNGFIVTINSGLLHNPALGTTADGGLTLTGGGTLILDALGTYTGRTTINSGLLVAYYNLSSPSIGNGPVTVNGGEAIFHSLFAGTVATALREGYNAGQWNGPTGINSTTAANDTRHLTAVGMLVPSSAITFYGQPLGTSDVAIKYTYYGDANLDGQVNSADYVRIDNGYLSHLTGWYNGDFNYDGIINGSDYTLIDNAFNMQGATIATAIATAQIAGTSSVPEPGSTSLLMLGCAALLGRRAMRSARMALLEP